MVSQARIYHGSYDDYIWSLRRGSMRRQDHATPEAHRSGKLASEATAEKNPLPSHREERERQKQAAIQKRCAEKRGGEIEARLEKLHHEQDQLSNLLLSNPSDMELVNKLAATSREIAQPED